LAESLHVTLMINHKGLFWEIVKDVNTQFTFLEFLINSIENNFLVRGSILILDNAAVHLAADTIELVFYIVNFCGIRLVFLPKYSPEMNPCELVFSYVKSNVYHHGITHNSILTNVEASFDKVTKKMIKNFYKKCFLIK
jgi:transposase